MDIAILGASGRVGRHLVSLVLESKEDTLAAAYVSPDSDCLGQAVDGTEISYQAIDALLDRSHDLLIDFSTPATTMAVLGDLKAYAGAVVIGTTGFAEAEMSRIDDAATEIPLMMSANFAESFEPFVDACTTLAATYPDVTPELDETYHVRKKAVPSGTSMRIVRDVANARREAGCQSDLDIPVNIFREGEVIGKHVFRVDLGSSALKNTFSVVSLESYARGALQAGRWVSRCPSGLYSAADFLNSKRRVSD